jgi:hypothetical protein
MIIFSASLCFSSEIPKIYIYYWTTLLPPYLKPRTSSIANVPQNLVGVDLIPCLSVSLRQFIAQSLCLSQSNMYFRRLCCSMSSQAVFSPFLVVAILPFDPATPSLEGVSASHKTFSLKGNFLLQKQILRFPPLHVRYQPRRHVVTKFKIDSRFQDDRIAC